MRNASHGPALKQLTACLEGLHIQKIVKNKNKTKQTKNSCKVLVVENPGKILRRETSGKVSRKKCNLGWL